MAQKIEIIPANSGCTPDQVNTELGSFGTAEFYEELSGSMVQGDELLSGVAYSIKISGRSYFLKKIKQDFEIEPAIDYLNEERQQGLDVQQIAKDWENSGVSYILSPDNPLEADPLNFISLVVAVCKCLGGVIFISSNDYKWCGSGIYSGDQFKGLYLELDGKNKGKKGSG